MVNIAYSAPVTRSPFIRDRKAVLFVAASTVILAYGAILGPIAIICFLAIWLQYLPTLGVRLLTPARTHPLVTAFLLWSCVSAAWSQYPSISIYSALEFSSLVVSTLIMSHIVRVHALLKGLALGSSLVLIASLIWGKYASDPFSGMTSMVGLFGSKNVVGMFSEITLLSTLLLWPSVRRFSEKLIFRLAAPAIALFCIHQSKSATSILSFAVAATMLLAMLLICKMPRTIRLLGFVFLATWAIVLGGIAYMTDFHEYVLWLFGKSNTLTGRTFLWQRGLDIASHQPIFGGGYNSFWVRGNIPAEHLWFKFGIANRTGFHFHNLFIQTYVDLGVIGALIMTCLILSPFLRSISALITFGPTQRGLFALTFSTMFLIRSYAEVDTIGTYNIGPFVFFSLIPMLCQQSSQLPTPPTGASAEHLRRTGSASNVNIRTSKASHER